MSQVLVQIPPIGEALAYKHGPVAFAAALTFIGGALGGIGLIISSIRRANLSARMRVAIGMVLVLVTGLSGCTLYLINIHIEPHDGNVIEPLGNGQGGDQGGNQGGNAQVNESVVLPRGQSDRKPLNGGGGKAGQTDKPPTDAPSQASTPGETGNGSTLPRPQPTGDSRSRTIVTAVPMNLPAATGCVFTQIRVGSAAKPSLSNLRNPQRSGWLDDREILQLDSAQNIGGCGFAAGSYQVRQVQHDPDHGTAEVKAFELRRRPQ